MSQSRRRFLSNCLPGAALISLLTARAGASRAAGDPLLKPDDPAARKLKYIEDASKAKEAAGNKCANCALYQGSNSSPEGPCQLFPGKEVKAAGWCTSWAPQL
jgi:hypothetical protein